MSIFDRSQYLFCNNNQVKEFSDSEIVDCLRRRESHVVRFLSERYLPMIRLMVFQNGGDSDDAHDIFQDGLIIMLEKIDNVDFNLTCKFKTYLYCVCENLWKSVLSKRKAAQNYMARQDQNDYEHDTSEAIDKDIYDKALREVINTLDPVSRKILEMYWEDISPQDIAAELGYTYGYVRKKKCEAQNELTEKFRRHPVYRKMMEIGIR